MNLSERSDESSIGTFEYRDIKMNPTLHAYPIPLQNERNLTIQNRTFPRNLGDSLLQRHFKQPTAYRGFTSLDYMDKVRLYNTLPFVHTSQQKSIPRDSGSPANFVVSHADIAEGHCIAKIRFVHPSNVELFSLRQILLQRNDSFFQNVKTWKETVYTTF